MRFAGLPARPSRSSYDVVIIGGAMLGSATAWFLADNPDFNGSVLVVERDPTYAYSGTARTNSCIRQQFSTDINVRVSQFGAEFFQNLRHYMGGDARVPQMRIQNYGYLYLADTDAFAEVLRDNQKVQAAAGAATRLLSAEEIKAAWPFYAVDDLVLGSINTVDEGYFDGTTMFECFRRQARERGVEYVAAEVVAMTLNRAGTMVENVRLASGEVIACGQVVNASGTRGAATAKMAGIAIPIEPRRRYTWVFTAEKPLDRDLPLTIDPTGFHVRQDGKTSYMAGGHSSPDPAADFDDFSMDQTLWQDYIWPAVSRNSRRSG